jgi:fructose-1,6-bisphosphatase/inositol monophosphatase family enzyme
MTRGHGRSATPEAEGQDALLIAVSEVARVAGDVAVSYFDQARRSALSIELKADGSPVTAADRAAESTAREWIERRFPADGIVGEELGVVRPTASRRWFIDPIDGTKSFVRGVPLWATLIAVAEGDTVLAGAIYCAAAGELVAAATARGSWWNGVRCNVSRVARLECATVLATEIVTSAAAAPAATRHRPTAGRSSGSARTRTAGGGTTPSDTSLRLQAWRQLAERADVARTWGDAYGYLLVATGRAEVMVDAIMHPWDTAALAPVITEAGGVFTDWDGAPTALGGSSIATNAALAEQVRAMLRPLRGRESRTSESRQ